MLTLYVKTDCPFSARVLAKGEELNLTFNLKNVADEGVSDELIARGGKKQEPFLVDEDRGVQLYEAKAIAAYLDEHYREPSPGAVGI
jgi:glutathione S-transferase